MNAYIMIGGSNTRKSSVCRALTGCFNRNVREIKTQKGETLRLYVRVAALQETRTPPEVYLAEVRKQGVHNTLFTLWPYAHTRDPHNYPDPQAYLDQFAKRGWTVSHIAILGQSVNPLQKESYRKISSIFPQTVLDPINVSAAGVRNFFGWV